MKPSYLIILAINGLGLAAALAISNTETERTVVRSIEDRSALVPVESLQKPKCFKTGAPYGKDEKRARNAAKKACRRHLKGTYIEREVRTKCYNIGSLFRKKSVEFSVGYTGGPLAKGSRGLEYDECVHGLMEHILNCPLGGDTTYGNWRYR
ncbi:hypothetical protein LIA77_04391 [Sarocladium implicatum]|nr:hypothetical protein LIA77_04391 [Sarocladium implicatum]